MEHKGFEPSSRILNPFIRLFEKAGEIGQVPGFPGSSIQDIKLLQNPALHFVGSLIGKGYRQDFAVINGGLKHLLQVFPDQHKSFT
jgi:hypothetical protein